MALFGTSGGLFGGGSAPQFQIVGISTSLISLSYDAKLTQAGYQSLSLADRDSINREARLGADPAVTAPWELPTETKTLNQKVRDARALTSFIDLRDPGFEAASGDPDKLATFAIYKALDNLRTLAEYAADKSTSSSSLGRLDDQFQMGFAEVRDFISTAEMDKLSLFMGDKEYTTETSTRLGKDQTGFEGRGVAASPDDVLTGLTGAEVFSVSITKLGTTEEITVDLSGMSSSLTLNNIVDYINTQVSAVPLLDENGDITYDADGNPVSKYSTAFKVSRDDSGQYSIGFNATILEEVSFSAVVSEPTLYVASTTALLDDEAALTGRVTELNGLSGAITVDGSFEFAATDLEATDINSRTADLEEDELDPRLVELRDKMLKESLAEVTGVDVADLNEEEALDSNETSLTNIDSDVKVNADTETSRIAVDSDGGIYVVGTTQGSMGHQINTAEDKDVYLTKFDSDGNVQFSRLLGVGDTAEVFGIVVDSEDNVIITGRTDSALTATDTFDTTDAFVTKISKRGDEVFTYQLDTFGETSGFSVAVDSNDDIIVGGYSKSVIGVNSTFSGGKDGLVLKLDGATGSLTSSTLFGTGGNEDIKGVAIASDGNIIVASEEDGTAVIRKLDSTDLSVELASYSLGSLGSGGSIESITVDGGDIYLVGTTTNAALGSTINGVAAGNQDGFVAKFSESGASVSYDYTTYLGTSGTDSIADVTISGGKLYVAGSTTETLTGEQAYGNEDGFVARLDAATGTVEDQEQFGRALAGSEVGGVAFTTKGNSVLSTLGLPTGIAEPYEGRTVTDQTSVREGDYFYISVDGGSRKKITIEAGDEFEDIARRIRIATRSQVEATASLTSEGEKLKISTVDGGPSIDLLPGEEGRDALAKLGLVAGKLLSKDEVFGLNDDKEYSEDNLGGAFGLKLEGALHIKDKTTAKYVLGLLDGAIETVQRAFRSLEFDPIKAALLNQKPGLNAAPSPYMAAKIANYSDALNRLQAMNFAPSGGGLF